MKLKSLDHKNISILENVSLACIEAFYMNGRKSWPCEHVVDGVLPRVVEVKAQADIGLEVKGEICHEITLWPAAFFCFDCMVAYLNSCDGAGTGTDLSAHHPAPVRTGV